MIEMNTTLQLENIITDVYCYLCEDFQVIQQHLTTYRQFIQEKITPNFGINIHTCPKELEEDYTPIERDFKNALKSIQNKMAEIGLSKDTYMRCIHHLKKNNLCIEQGLISKIEAIDEVSKTYNGKYHAYKSVEKINVILNERAGFITMCDEMYSHKQQARMVS